MNDDHRTLARGLFVVATEILEDAHPIAATGQRHDQSRERCTACAAALETAAYTLSLLTRTAALVAERDPDTANDDPAPP